MIYLFDDKVNRQVDYGWDYRRFEKYIDVIQAVHLYKEVEDDAKRNEIFSDGNIILFHESFFDNVINKNTEKAIEIRNNLRTFALKSHDFSVIYFSGSKSTRKLDDKVGYIPVSILYQNLELFIKKVQTGNNDLRYLIFGENHQIEKILINKLESANNSIDDSIVDNNPKGRNFIAQTLENEIEEIFENARYESFFLEEKYNYDITDDYLSEKVVEWFSEEVYDNIYIPVCFGPVLSDYNGLRFALHLRTTRSSNQLTRIFLYSFVEFEDLIGNEYFDILKTKNVSIVNYSKLAFSNAIEQPKFELIYSNLKQELKKVNLSPPKNYEDNHSIANEWAIYRWASAIDALDNDIEKINNRVNNHIYFKLLATIYPQSEVVRIHENDLKFDFTGSPKILYIDDEADKGWHEIFCTILNDINKLDYTYLDEELANLKREEIISLSLEKIVKNNIDIVVLDFRLHPDDFIANNIDEITGLRLLREIKSMNPGIQVIMFSASNKVWNLEALQDAGADGFIVKESPTDSFESSFTKNTIINMTKKIQSCLDKYFLKDFYSKLNNVRLELIPRKNVKSENPLPKEFVDEVIKWTEIGNASLCEELVDSDITAAYLFYFSVLENIANRIIDVDNPIKSEKRSGYYRFEFRQTAQRLKNFVPDVENPGYYRKTKSVLESKRNIPWILKILNAIEFISEGNLTVDELNSIVKCRNDIIHANSTTGEVIDLEIKNVISLFGIIYNGLISIR
jgi:CheY-like chemotaxis protein